MAVHHAFEGPADLDITLARFTTAILGRLYTGPRPWPFPSTSVNMLNTMQSRSDNHGGWLLCLASDLTQAQMRLWSLEIQYRQLEHHDLPRRKRDRQEHRKRTRVLALTEAILSEIAAVEEDSGQSDDSSS